jgi:hypothetical protein
MFVTTAPSQARGRTGDARLRADLDALGRLDADRLSASVRLEQALGRELALHLVAVLSRGAAGYRDQLAA